MTACTNLSKSRPGSRTGLSLLLRIAFIPAFVAACDHEGGFVPTAAPKPTVAASAAPADSGSSDHCEITTEDGHNACEENHSHGGNGGNEGAAIAMVAGLAAIGLANEGNFGGASAILQAAAPLVDTPAQSEPVSGDGSCTPGPRCARARADWQAQLAAWESESQGAGVGRLYGYAYCGSDLTRQVAQLCADEQRAMGEMSCASTLEANARDAAAKAEEAIVNGRDVGVDARQTGPCG